MIFLILFLGAVGPSLPVLGGLPWGSLYSGGVGWGWDAWNPGWSGWSPAFYSHGPWYGWGPGFNFNGTDGGPGGMAGAGAGAGAAAGGDAPAGGDDSPPTEEISNGKSEVVENSSSSEEIKQSKNKRKSIRKIQKTKDKFESDEEEGSESKILEIPDITPFPKESKAIRELFQTLAKHDNGSCFEKLFCDIHVKASRNAKGMTNYEESVVDMFKSLETDDVDPSSTKERKRLTALKYIKAAELGKHKRSSKACREKYPGCRYSTEEIKTMSDIMKKI